MLFLCRIFITAKIFITSTHTNYFDRLVKEPGDYLPLSPTIIQSQNSLSTSFLTFFLRPCLGKHPRGSRPLYIILMTCQHPVQNKPSIPFPLQRPSPKELRIIQTPVRTSRFYSLPTIKEIPYVIFLHPLNHPITFNLRSPTSN